MHLFKFDDCTESGEVNTGLKWLFWQMRYE